jgi:hypothetical protein
MVAKQTGDWDPMELKKQIQQFAEIAKECPENLQETCFRLLLENYLGTKKPVGGDGVATIKDKKPEDEPPKPPTDTPAKQGDIQQSDIHVKVKRFMEKNAVTLDDLNLVFYKEGDAFMPLFDSLGTTKTSQSQIRVALLRCLRTALATGEFECPLEEVRTECQQRKCYDRDNWRNNFVNNGSLFDNDTFTKDVTLKLSDDGKKELATVVKALK